MEYFAFRAFTDYRCARYRFWGQFEGEGIRKPCITSITRAGPHGHAKRCFCNAAGAGTA